MMGGFLDGSSAPKTPAPISVTNLAELNAACKKIIDRTLGAVATESAKITEALSGESSQSVDYAQQCRDSIASSGEASQSAISKSKIDLEIVIKLSLWKSSVDNLIEEAMRDCKLNMGSFIDEKIAKLQNAMGLSYRTIYAYLADILFNGSSKGHNLPTNLSLSQQEPDLPTPQSQGHDTELLTDQAQVLEALNALQESINGMINQIIQITLSSNILNEGTKIESLTGPFNQRIGQTFSNFPRAYTESADGRTCTYKQYYCSSKIEDLNKSLYSNPSELHRELNQQRSSIIAIWEAIISQNGVAAREQIQTLQAYYKGSTIKPPELYPSQLP